jgi:DNA-binding transcriptional ArsR family regulator
VIEISTGKWKSWQLSSQGEILQLLHTASQKLPILNQDSDLQQLALFYKALGDETRLKIIGLLLVQDVCLCEIVEALQVPASTVNHHLRILERGGIREGRREGKFTIYSLMNNNVRPSLMERIQSEDE